MTQRDSTFIAADLLSLDGACSELLPDLRLKVGWGAEVFRLGAVWRLLKTAVKLAALSA
jgi:hypothetical protein